MFQLINKIRFYHYMSGVLINQKADPLCSKCKPFVNTAAAMRTDLDEMKKEHSDDIRALSKEMQELLDTAESRITSLEIPEDAEGQKKAGNCHMPKGACFVKSSKALLKSMTEGEI